MSATKKIKETFRLGYSGKNPEFKKMYKERLIHWRKEPTVVRLEKPTNPARAKEIGYKAKQGVVVARIKIRRGSGLKTRPDQGRKPSKMGRAKKKISKSIQSIAEERVGKKFPNLEVLNSYWVGEDGQRKFFEVIMIDPTHPAIQRDKDYKKILTDTRRVFRGKTSAGKKGKMK